jgi:hypothetical protein
LAAIWVAVALVLFSLARWLNAVGVDEAFSQSLLAFLQLRSETTLDLAERVVGIILIALVGLAMHRNFKR